MKATRFFVVAAAALAAAIALPIDALAQKGAAAKPGRYTDFNDIDEVTIVQPFQLRNYKRVVVQRVGTKGALLPDAKDNSYPHVKAALANSTGVFAKGVRDDLKGMAVDAGGRGGAGTLVIRARVTKSDPGSQAVRHFASFGAGAAKVAITGEILDGGTNKVLARFTQERRSGFGVFGGGYRELLERNIHQIGGDVAGLLRAF